jgi:hypothetical protein
MKKMICLSFLFASLLAPLAQAETISSGYVETETSHIGTNLISSCAESASTNLSCTCYGGPGNYPYPCAPITTTCYGGPGNYPYPCTICPQ